VKGSPGIQNINCGILAKADPFRQTFHPELDVAKQLGREIFRPQLALAQKFPLLRGACSPSGIAASPAALSAVGHAKAEVSPPGLRSLPDLSVSQAAGVTGQSHPNTGPEKVF
jgi:hypothetical protein